ncbi:hypothetical protein I7I51_03797 [Histoplasma capsulatum]|uniref:Uncharacterized protein n=1 Tax=Ajellomyces capsulatus TaxID=5037 RepID=A0A8A1M8P3_AJECA|nr:hypothetical protein I7I51_03797 [Histoplasma capsulatum]
MGPIGILLVQVIMPKKTQQALDNNLPCKPQHIITSFIQAQTWARKGCSGKPRVKCQIPNEAVCREVHDHTASQPATGPLWIRNYEERGTLRSLGYPPGAITSLVGLTKNGPFTTFLRYTREKT